MFHVARVGAKTRARSAAATAGLRSRRRCGRPGEQGAPTRCTAQSAHLADEPSVDVQGAAQRETKRRDREAASGGAVSATGVLPAGASR